MTLSGSPVESVGVVFRLTRIRVRALLQQQLHSAGVSGLSREMQSSPATRISLVSQTGITF
jgi:hypothetical protein